MRRAAPQVGTPRAHPSPWLSDAAQERLRARLAAARRKARPGVAGARQRHRAARRVPRPGGDRVRLARQPGKPGSVSSNRRATATAHAGIGVTLALEASGPRPLHRALDQRWRALSERAVCDFPDAPPGAGLVAVAGFAFADDGAASPAWRGFGAASLTVPAVWLARRGRGHMADLQRARQPRR